MHAYTERGAQCRSASSRLLLVARILVVGDSHALAQDDEVVTVEPERQPLSVQAMLRDDSHAESWRRVLEHLKRRRLSTGWRRAGLTARLMSDLNSRCGWRGGLYFAPASVRAKLGTSVSGRRPNARPARGGKTHSRKHGARSIERIAAVPCARIGPGGLEESAPGRFELALVIRAPSGALMP